MYKDKEAHKKWTNKRDAKHKIMVKQIMSDFRKSGCLLCGEKEECCLDAHHVNPKTKKFSLGSLSRLRFSKVKILEELIKCVCVCRNCHAKIHAGVLGYQLP